MSNENIVYDPEFIKNTTTTITIFGENALRTAAQYLTHGKRKIVTKEDIKRALILEMFIFNKRKINNKHFKNVKKELFKNIDNFNSENDNSENDDSDNDNSENDDSENNDSENDDSENDDSENDDSENNDSENDDSDKNTIKKKPIPNYIVDNTKETFSLNKCNCRLCECINNIYDEWEEWEPSNEFEKIFEKHINNI